MNRFIIPCLCMVILAGCGGSGGSTTPTSTPVPPVIVDPPIVLPDEVGDYQLRDTDEYLAEITSALSGLNIGDFFEVSYQAIARRSPERVIADGQAGQMQLESFALNDISDAFYFQTVALKSLILEKLQTYDHATFTEADQLSYDVYMAYLEYEIEWAQYRDFEYPATFGNYGWPGATELFVTDLLPLATVEDAENYLTITNQIARRITQVMQLLDARKAAGIIEPAITLNFSQNTIAAIGNGAATNSPYYTDFASRLDAETTLSDADKTALKERLEQIIAQRVLPAYQQLAQKMTTLSNDAPVNIGFGQFDGGLAFYDFTLRFYTSGNKTADQIHQQGISELQRIHSQMRALFDQLGYPQSETLSQLYSRADSDGGIIPGNQAVAFYEDIIAKAYTELPAVFSVLPQQEVVVIGGNTGGFYVRGSDDGARPGAFYANVSGNLPYTRMPTLAYHEAVPGHHLQIALANEMDLPQFRRKEGFTSFIEGWGLYAERLASDLGWYHNDVYGDLGRLQFEAMRAARLVVDTGIHNKGWSYQQADQFHLENVGFNGSIARYSVFPGQATAYMTGMLKILELRDRAKTQMGDRYEIKDFHAEVVGNGAMPLDILEAVIERYIVGK